MFDPVVRYMFEGVDDMEHYPNGPFTNTTRMLLVDSILMNITFLNDQEILKLRIENKLKNIVNKNKTTTLNMDRLLPVVAKPFDAFELANNKSISKKNEDKKVNSCKGK
jgi:hypothetical protein